MIQLCLRWKIIACSLNDAFADAISFMPNHAAIVVTIRNGTQMKPAFWSQIFVPSEAVCASPPTTPNTLAVMARGTTNCTTLTPRFPRPALMASACPFCFLGKKKLMLAIEDAKFPPPKPHRSARTRNRR